MAQITAKLKNIGRFWSLHHFLRKEKEVSNQSKLMFNYWLLFPYHQNLYIEITVNFITLLYKYTIATPLQLCYSISLTLCTVLCQPSKNLSHCIKRWDSNKHWTWLPYRMRISWHMKEEVIWYCTKFILYCKQLFWSLYFRRSTYFYVLVCYTKKLVSIA